MKDIYVNCGKLAGNGRKMAIFSVANFGQHPLLVNNLVVVKNFALAKTIIITNLDCLLNFAILTFKLLQVHQPLWQAGSSNWIRREVAMVDG